MQKEMIKAYRPFAKIYFHRNDILIKYHKMKTSETDEPIKTEGIKGKSIPILMIGDAKEPRKAPAAIAEGAKIGRKI